MKTILYLFVFLFSTFYVDGAITKTCYVIKVKDLKTRPTSAIKYTVTFWSGKEFNKIAKMDYCKHEHEIIACINFNKKDFILVQIVSQDSNNSGAIYCKNDIFSEEDFKELLKKTEYIGGCKIKEEDNEPIQIWLIYGKCSSGWIFELDKKHSLPDTIKLYL